MRQLTVVLGTGRCGSTLLSTVLNRHPRVLSLSEFFTSLDPDAFPVEQIDGDRFWAILSTPRSKAMTQLRHGVAPAEYLYPFGSGRFTAETGVPPISLVSLPHLSDRPDEVLDEIEAAVTGWDRASVAVQYGRLFDWLCDRFDRDVVVERSGASLRFVPGLRACFPDARYLYLDRDGSAASVSMSRHPSFRLEVRVLEMMDLLGVDPYLSPSADHADRLPPELRCLLPDRFDGAALMSQPIPLPVFGMIWAHLVADGVSELDAVPTDRIRYLRYEDVLADPLLRFREIAAMLGVDAPDEWLAEAVTLVRPGSGTGRSELPEPERRALREACEPGTQALRALRERLARAPSATS
jgi:putative sulfotransferase